MGVDGQLPAPSTKPAMGTTTSIHIQILPGRRKREAIDCGMEGYRGKDGGIEKKEEGGA